VFDFGARWKKVTLVPLFSRSRSRSPAQNGGLFYCAHKHTEKGVRNTSFKV